MQSDDPATKAAPGTHRSSSDPGHDDRDDGDVGSDNGIVLHKSEFKFACVYWRHGFSLPENGRMSLCSGALYFNGIVGTKLSFDLNDVSLTKTSRMGGLVHDAFILTISSAASAVDDESKFLFSTVLKDRKHVIDKVEAAIGEAIGEAKLAKEEDGVDASSKKKKKKFHMPPDPTLQKMKIIAERKLKGVSLQDYYEVVSVFAGAFLETSDCLFPSFPLSLHRRGPRVLVATRARCTVPSSKSKTSRTSQWASGSVASGRVRGARNSMILRGRCPSTFGSKPLGRHLSMLSTLSGAAVQVMISVLCR